MTVETQAYIAANYESERWQRAREERVARDNRIKRERETFAERDALYEMAYRAALPLDASLGIRNLASPGFYRPFSIERHNHQLGFVERVREIHTVCDEVWENGGFDEYPDDVRLYLIANRHADAVKVGMVGPRSKRIEEWRGGGWNVIKVWRVTERDGFSARQRAQAVERAVVTMWRIHFRAGYGGQPSDYSTRSGMTESAPQSAISLHETVSFIDASLEGCDRR